MNNGPTSPRPRSRAFSFRSDKSGGEKGNNKLDLTESPKEKQRRDSIRTSKANPNAAITEAQPGSRSPVAAESFMILFFDLTCFIACTVTVLLRSRS